MRGRRRARNGKRREKNNLPICIVLMGKDRCELCQIYQLGCGCLTITTERKAGKQHNWTIRSPKLIFKLYARFIILSLLASVLVMIANNNSMSCFSGRMLLVPEMGQKWWKAANARMSIAQGYASVHMCYAKKYIT